MYRKDDVALAAMLERPGRTFVARLISVPDTPGKIVSEVEPYTVTMLQGMTVDSLQGVVVDGIRNSIVKLTHTSALVSGEGFEAGTAISGYIEVECLFESKEDIPPIEGVEFELKIGVLPMYAVENTIWVPMGHFTATTPEVNKTFVKFTAYDRTYTRMLQMYNTELTIPETGVDGRTILNEIRTQSGMNIDYSIIPAGQLIKSKAVSASFDGEEQTVYMPPFTGYSHREALAEVLRYYGCCATCDRDGKIIVKKPVVGTPAFTVLPSTYYDDLTLADKSFSVDSVELVVDNNESYIAGTATSDKTLHLSVPSATQANADFVYNNLKDSSFVPARVSFLGDIRLDVGDTVKVVDPAGNETLVPIMYMQHTFDGGIKTEIASFGIDSQESKMYNGPSMQKMDRMYTELLYVNELIASSIKALRADIDVAKINQLVVDNLYIKGDDGLYYTLKPDSKGITASQVASIDPVLHGSQLVSETVTTNKIAASAITAAKIDTDAVTADKIKAGSITADKIAADAVTADKIDVKNLTAVSSNLGGWILNDRSIYKAVTASGKKRVTGFQHPGSGTWAIAVNASSEDSWADAPFRVNHDGKMYATDADVSGKITTSSGKIGGFDIGTASISKGTKGSAGSVYVGTDAIQCGSRFKVDNNGVVTIISPDDVFDIAGYLEVTNATDTKSVGISAAHVNVWQAGAETDVQAGYAQIHKANGNSELESYSETGEAWVTVTADDGLVSGRLVATTGSHRFGLYSDGWLINTESDGSLRVAEDPYIVSSTQISVTNGTRTGTLYLNRKGKIVYAYLVMQLKADTANAVQSLLDAGTIPLAYRPSREVVFQVRPYTTYNSASGNLILGSGTYSIVFPTGGAMKFACDNTNAAQVRLNAAWVID